MADNLPLIPNKRSVCKDVRPVLRTVFRELDFLPPLAGDITIQITGAGEDGDNTSPPADRWVEQCKAEDKDIAEYESELKHKFAARIAKRTLPNIYKIHHAAPEGGVTKWKLERGIIERKDLTPSIQQDAGTNHSLWIKNILNASSSNIIGEKTSCVPSPASISAAVNNSFQIYSTGEVISRPSPAPQTVPPSEAPPNCILCVPSKLDFVNCAVGRLYTKRLRLINVSKFECRISISPTRHRELDVEISGYRGLTVTSGAATELKVNFRPTDVRALSDVLAVRVSCGQTFGVPIACYMRPPLLHISVPSLSSCLLLCNSEASMEYKSSCGLNSDVHVVELGTRLLGDARCTPILLRCDEHHADFFMLTEDAWSDWNIDCLTSVGSVVAGPFVVWPAWWRGGGVVRAHAYCCHGEVGVHHAELRLLSSTATTRQLHLLADVLHFTPHHLVIEAHERDYDICSDEDPVCEYYVNLGTTFPRRSLSITVQLVNRSPIVYSYYWKLRPWGVCCCWEQENQRIHAGSIGTEDNMNGFYTEAAESKNKIHEDYIAYAKKDENAYLVKVDPDQGQIQPRSTCPIHVKLPDAGENLGARRAVLMLILQDIPIESIPANYVPMIVKTKMVESTPIPGVQSSSREVCDLLAAQVEVWWHVAPVRFVLNPPVLPLYYSPRVKSTVVCVSSWLLFGRGPVHASWVTPPHVPRPAPLSLTTMHSASTTITVPLPPIPTQYSETEVLKLVAENNEWYAQCTVQRQCMSRCPSLRPAAVWLGVVPPGAAMNATLHLINDTYQEIHYWCKSFQWWGENAPKPKAIESIPCASCKKLSCSCATVTPGRGTVEDTHIADIFYSGNAPMHDGCVALLIQARRCGDDLGYGPSGARAALVMYRVLAPQLILRLLPCLGLGSHCSASCGLDTGALGSERGTAILRPNAALVVGRATCYRLRITNTTAVATAVHFDKPIDGTDALNVNFIPNDFSVEAYDQAVVRVVLSARRVCERHVFVYRATVDSGHRPLYLVVDAAIAGLQISCQVAVEENDQTEHVVIIRRTQGVKYASGQSERHPRTPTQIFAEEDRRRNTVKAEESPQVTHVHRCEPSSKPLLSDTPEAISLQFINVPLRRVCERRLVLRNESVVTAQWVVTVRRWPRTHVRTLEKDQWAADVGPSGLVVACRPAHGVLLALAHEELRVQVYADCWGLYWEQILIQVENVDPIILDVWIEAVGSPLQVMAQEHNASEETPTVWLSSSDSNRSLRVKNTSRCELIVHAYITQQYEQKRDVLPFRVYVRLYDVQPARCVCRTACDCDFEGTSEASSDTEIGIGIELYIAPDCGPQSDLHYKVNPEICCVKAGDSFKWNVTMDSSSHLEHVPSAFLMLRLLPVNRTGECWYRAEPPVQLIRLRQAVRVPRLQLSCDDVTVHICALDLPFGNPLRIRKSFHIQNVGNGTLDVSVDTAPPWCVLQGSRNPHTAEKRVPRWNHEGTPATLTLPPESSAEICVEVAVSAKEAWPPDAGASGGPCAMPQYPQHRRDITSLHIYNDYEVFVTLPLVLDIEYPVLQVQPDAIDFGVVTDGDSRKTYVSISHTSHNKTLQLITQWVGCEEFEIWPQRLAVPPGRNKLLYIQYTAVWRHGPAEGICHVAVCGGADGLPMGPDATSTEVGVGWCRAAVTVRATPARDHKWHTDPHDHTDDDHLLPPLLRHYVT